MIFRVYGLILLISVPAENATQVSWKKWLTNPSAICDLAELCVHKKRIDFLFSIYIL